MICRIVHCPHMLGSDIMAHEMVNLLERLIHMAKGFFNNQSEHGIRNNI